jgi:hypothetical protein
MRLLSATSAVISVSVNTASCCALVAPSYPGQRRECAIKVCGVSDGNGVSAIKVFGCVCVRGVYVDVDVWVCLCVEMPLCPL